MITVLWILKRLTLNCGDINQLLQFNLIDVNCRTFFFTNPSRQYEKTARIVGSGKDESRDENLEQRLEK